MVNRGIAKLLERLRREMPPGPDLMPDSTLLGRYVAERDEAAFELLVRRHGAMVLATAKRVLRDSHAAEDVFQAAFLALARKAHTLRRSGSVASWLHRVSWRAALRLRPTRQLVQVSSLPSTEAPAWELTELRAVLDEEVARLPSRLREAVVHCYLAGRTAEEAAQTFGCPRGTVLSRLAAARERLRVQLTRRGYALPAVGVAALWASETATAISPALVALAVRAAGPAAAIAPGIVNLAEGVLHAMFMTKIKVASALVVAVGLVGFGVGNLGAGPVPQEPKSVEKAPATTEQRDDKDTEARRDLVEKQLIEALTQASTRRIDLRIRIEDMREQEDELRRERDRLQKLFEKFDGILFEIEERIVLSQTSDYEASGDSAEKAAEYAARALKASQERLERTRKALGEVKQRDDKLRAQLSANRREVLKAEEELKLLDQLTTLKTQKLQRQLP